MFCSCGHDDGWSHCNACCNKPGQNYELRLFLEAQFVEALVQEKGFNGFRT